MFYFLPNLQAVASRSVLVSVSAYTLLRQKISKASEFTKLFLKFLILFLSRLLKFFSVHNDFDDGLLCCNIWTLFDISIETYHQKFRKDETSFGSGIR